MAEKNLNFYVKPFDGNSYSNWDFRIKLLLEQHDVLGVLTEQQPAATRMCELEKWKKSDVKARAIIIQCLSDSILESVKTKKTAAEIMKSLENSYAKKGISTQVMLQKKLRSLRYTEGTSLSRFLTEFDNTICELKAAGGKIDESELILQLLSTMPESFQSVTTAIDIMFCQNQDAIDLDFVRNKLLMEEARQAKLKEEENPNMAFMSKNFRGRGNFRRPGGAYRGGFSHSYNGTNPNSSAGNSSGNSNVENFPFKCHLCDRVGHKRADCPMNRSRRGGYRGNFRRGVSGGYSQRSNAHSAQETTEASDDEHISFLSTGSSLFVTNEDNISFVIDSGATNHLIRKDLCKFLQGSKNIEHKISVAKQGQTIMATKQGNLELETETGRQITIKNVWVCENLLYNLLSVRKLEENGLEVNFSNGKVIIMKNKVCVLEGQLKRRLYFVNFKLNKNVYANLTSEEEKVLKHRKMGHSSKFPAVGICEVCVKAKQAKIPYEDLPQERKAKRVLETVSTDICGPLKPTTFDGKSYFMTFIDHFSHFCVTYLLSNKSEALEKCKSYVAMVEAKFGAKIEKLRCDNGGEYVSKDFKLFCDQKGIKIQYTVAYNPEQNGKAERLNRTIMEKARCLIFDAELGKELWGEAVRTSVYLINRTETRALENHKTPAEIWNSEKPNLEKIKLFGCNAYNLIPKEMRKSKLDPRSEKMIMVGYADNGYRLWNEKEGKIVHGRNIIFEEQKKELDNRITPITRESDNDKPKNDENLTEKRQTGEEEMKKHEEIEKVENKEDRQTRTSSRKINIPRYLQDYELEDDMNFFAALSAGDVFAEVPKSYSEAVVQDRGWKDAIKEELSALEENETWKLVMPPKCAEIIDSRWVFSEKVVEGRVKKKARLVARGFKQSVISDDVYAPVARMASIRMLLSLYVEFKLQVCQLDVKSAFLNGTLKDPVFMYPPEGLDVQNSSLVCKLQKALYGLRQSPKCWNSLFNDNLMELGFQRSRKDPCLYFTDTIYLLIHVDDIILFSKCQESLDFIKSSLLNRFKMTEFKSDIISFLGLEILKVGDTVYIKQTDLIKRILKRFDMLQCKPHDLPMQPKFQIDCGDRVPVCDQNLPYRELIGSLMYVMLGTRPDLSFCISYFSQFQNCYTIEHWKYLKHTLRYLNKTQDFGLKFSKSENSKINIVAYADSDFANNISDRKSISGFLIKINNNIVEWKTRKQNVVALSSAESEYLSLSACVRECLFLGQMLSEILSVNLFPINVFEDNQSCIKMASTMETKRTKHIDVRHHFLRECVEQEKIILNYVPTENQQADILTKALANPKFKNFRNSLNVVEIEK